MSKKELTFKICIFGDKNVGKTTLTNYYLTHQFDESIKPTLGAAIHIKFLDIENFRIVLQIWDFGGEDSYKFLLPAYSRGSFGGIYMYDISNLDSLENVETWLSVFREGLDSDEKDNPILMVGGKLDLENEREVFNEHTNEIIKSTGIFDCIECSSKTGKNVEVIFEAIVRRILKDFDFLT